MRARTSFCAPWRHAVWIMAGLAVAQPARAQALDHGRFDRLLSAHVDERGRVDYDAFAASSEFDHYLNWLDAADPTKLPEADALALWINAYNAYTIELINRHEERRSIRDINRTFGVFSLKGPWSVRFAKVGGVEYTLDEIEHEIIRKTYGEPRIHFALVCAALGCPPLRREAYTGDRLDAQLDDQARRFLRRSPDHNRVEIGARRLLLSPIFDWYADDFGGTPGQIGRYLARFFPAGPEKDLLESGDFELRYSKYDWSLNSL